MCLAIAVGDLEWQWERATKRGDVGVCVGCGCGARS